MLHMIYDIYIYIYVCMYIYKYIYTYVYIGIHVYTYEGRARWTPADRGRMPCHKQMTGSA